MKFAMSSFQAFKESDGGSVAITFAAVLVPVLCSFGVAIDYSRAATARTALQASLDSAALNVVRSAATMTDVQLYEAVQKNVQASFSRPEVSNLVITPQYSLATRTLTVSGTGSLSTRMMNIVGFQTMQIASLATAASSAEPAACVIALDTNSTKSLTVSGNGSINVPNCGIQVNSSANLALEQKGASSIKAKSTSVVGGSNGSNITPPAKENQPAVPDPLSSIQEPVIPGACSYSNKDFDVVQTLPGNSVYCGNIGLNANITFGPGIHYFKNASVSVGSSAHITANEVMLYFDGSSSFSSTSSGTFKITAMPSGPYAGVAVFGSRTGNMQQFRFRGSNEYFVNGTIYLPNAHFNLHGSSDISVSAKSGFVIAKTFSYTGDASFTFDAHGGVVPAAFGSVKPRLSM